MRRSKTKRLRNCSATLHGESLELRKLLHGSGVGWSTSADQYSLSFAPDGTNVGPKKSELFEELAHLGEPSVWQDTILRGFQTWARETDIDLLVVDDDGTDLGVGGPDNHDPRFGDVRVAAIPFRENVSSHLVPTDQEGGRTWTGDFILNSRGRIRTLDDLFALAVHEAGHLFGLEHSDDPNSPMFGASRPTAVSPTPDDILHLRENYVDRQLDAFDVEGSAEVLVVEVDADEKLPAVVYGGLQSAEDVDRFRVSPHVQGLELTSVHLVTDQISNLRATLSLRSHDGTLLAEAPFGTEQMIRIADVDLAGSKHEDIVIEVFSVDDDAPYDAGRYSLVIEQPREVTSDLHPGKFQDCIQRLIKSTKRTRTPAENSDRIKRGCHAFANEQNVPLEILLEFNQGEVLGVQPVDPTEAPFCGFEWLDDLFQCLIWGDVDGDGRVGFDDFLKLSANFGDSNAEREDGDLDDDGHVGFSDFLILSRTFGETVEFQSIDGEETDRRFDSSIS